MKNFTYRVTSQAANNVLCAGGIRGNSLDDAFARVLKIAKITVKDEYYDEDSMMAGCIWRTSFINKDGKRVFVSISPNPANWRDSA